METVLRIKQDVKKSHWLAAWAKELLKTGLTPEEAIERAIEECRPLPAPEWIALAKASFLSTQRQKQNPKESLSE